MLTRFSFPSIYGKRMGRDFPGKKATNNKPNIQLKKDVKSDKEGPTKASKQNLYSMLGEQMQQLELK